MKLTTVLASVNLNPNYYLFIPKQILFWNKFDIKFIAVVIGDKLPKELIEYSSNIILWNKNLNLNTAFVAQNLRIYYPALLNLPDDEMVMITDMDMLPTNDKYYKEGIDIFTHNDFIYYREISGNQIYMCYNAAHPEIWGNVFGIKCEKNIEDKINETYVENYNGIPGSNGWFKDQEIMYNCLIKYPHLKILNKPINRLEIWIHQRHLNNNNSNFIQNYDDAHYHRSYLHNVNLILNAEKELNI